MVFDCVTRTHVGHKRKLNEDAVLDCTARGIWAVADGMGGHHAGEVASAMVVAALGNSAPAADIEGRIGKIVDVLEAVNDSLQELARASAGQRTIGATVVGLVADDRQYRCFWAGDSRAYRLRDGGIEQITRDHSLVQDLVDAGMIEQDEADKHPNANVVTRAIGAENLLRVDTVGGALNDGDVFLLASDGLTRLVEVREMLAEVATHKLEAAADRLVALALDRGAPDNVSLILVKVATSG